MNVPNGHFSEKSATKSKKYMAAMRFNLSWLIVIGMTFAAAGTAHAFEAPSLSAGMVTLLLAEIVCMGFNQALYLGGQAAVDTFVRMAVVIVTGKNGKVLAGETPATTPAPESEPSPTPAPEPEPEPEPQPEPEPEPSFEPEPEGD